MTSTTLKAAALWWLRLEKQVPLVAFEYSGDGFSWSDVFAVDHRRLSIEVEVKVSASDLRRELKKKKYHDMRHLERPSYFYLCVPKELRELALEIKQPEWGVLIPTGGRWMNGGHCLYSAAPAKRIHDTKVAMSDCVRLAVRQVAMLADLAVAHAERVQAADDASVVAAQEMEKQQ